MNHETTIKRIQELVPSLVQTASHLFKGNNLRCSHCGATSQQDFDGIECIEIIGKPITLSVALMAIEAKMKMKSGNRGGELIMLWNLSKDNFNDQSEETKTFIGVLLGN